MEGAEELTNKINQQGQVVRDLKTAKADKAAVQAAVDVLLALKTQYKTLTGKDFVAPAPAPAAAPAATQSTDKKAKKDDKKPESKADTAKEETSAKKPKKEEKKASKAELSPSEGSISAASLGNKIALYLGENHADNMKVALTVVQCGRTKDFVAVPYSKANEAKFMSLPALYQASTSTTVFGSTAAALYVASGQATSSNRDSNVNRALFLEELVLAPAMAKGSQAEVESALALLEQTAEVAVAAWPLAGALLFPRLSVALTGRASAFPRLAAVTAAVASGAQPSTAEQWLTGKAAALPAPTRAVLEGVDWQSAGLLSSLRSIFTAALQAAFSPSLGLNLEAGLLTANLIRCNNPAFGDFQCNNAMALSKAVKAIADYNGPVAPKDIAERILAGLPENPLIASAVAAPNGFINIHISTATMVQSISSIVLQSIQPPQLPLRKVLVDFSSPNIAKEMHVGHLRSTIIGDCVCRLLEFCGYEVLRVNHVGDWGTQFGMLITYLLEAYPNILELADKFSSGDSVSSLDSSSSSSSSSSGGGEGQEDVISITNLTAIYKASKKKFDDDANNFKERSRLNVVALQSGDVVCTKIWKLLCTISRLEFEKVYKLLDITLQEMGESVYNPFIPGVIEELQRKGLVFEDQGMQVLKLDHFTIPLIMRKSDGGYGYDSTDMTALKYRLFVLQRDWVIIITDAGQATHFHMCYDAGQAAGWVDNDRQIISQPPAVGEKVVDVAIPAHAAQVMGTEAQKKKCRLDHIGFGVVCGEDGKRFKTRSSETVRLIDLLNAARDQMYDALMERIREGKSSFTIEENAEMVDGRYAQVLQAAEMIGYGAVKYFDLKQHPSTNYVFNYERMLDTKGDTAVYLMFAYARLASILRKAEQERGLQMASIFQEAQQVLEMDHPAERALAFELLQFGDMIKSILQDLLPNRLCDYLKEISVKFTDFVTRCHVLNAPEEKLMKSRLVLCEATRRAMEKCFFLLGIKPLERI